jgi:hypothetical protein
VSHFDPFDISIRGLFYYFTTKIDSRQPSVKKEKHTERRPAIKQVSRTMFAHTGK